MADFDLELEDELEKDFQAEVDNRIKQLKNKDPQIRRAAAQWLGESGEPRAIQPLAQYYEKVKDATAKKEAAYALGQFKALEEALERGEQDRVADLLTKVIREGEFGQRAPVPAALLYGVMGALGLLLLALIGLNLMVATAGTPPAEQVADQPTASDAITAPSGVRDPGVIAQELLNTLELVRADAAKLSLQYQGAAAGDIETWCSDFFNDAPLFVISADERAAYPDLASSVDALNQAQSDLLNAKAAWDTACATIPATPFDAAQTAAAVPILNAIDGTLSALQPQVEIFRVDAQAATNAAVPTSGDAAPPVDGTVTETPTRGPEADPRTHVLAMYGIIDEMTGTRGANSLLTQYWTDGLNTGDTEGCRRAAPIIPPDYVLPADIASTYTDLESARLQLNIGLQSMRLAWSSFTQACQQGTVQGTASTGLEATNLVQITFSNAAALLDIVRAAVGS